MIIVWITHLMLAYIYIKTNANNNEALNKWD